MIYNELFSATARLKDKKLMDQAKQVTVGDLLFNHLNPGFAFMMMVMRDINKLTE